MDTDLENYNSALTDCLRDSYKFSTKLTHITHHMDQLLNEKNAEIAEKRAQIARLESELAESLTKKGDEIVRLESELAESLQKTADISMEMDIGSNEPEVDVNDYIIYLPPAKMDVERNADGYFECPEPNCDYKSRQGSTDIIHGHECPNNGHSFRLLGHLRKVAGDKHFSSRKSF